MVEQPAVNRRVTGSSPVSGAIFPLACVREGELPRFWHLRESAVFLPTCQHQSGGFVVVRLPG